MHICLVHRDPVADLLKANGTSRAAPALRVIRTVNTCRFIALRLLCRDCLRVEEYICCCRKLCYSVLDKADHLLQHMYCTESKTLFVKSETIQIENYTWFGDIKVTPFLSIHSSWLYFFRIIDSVKSAALFSPKKTNLPFAMKRHNLGG